MHLQFYSHVYIQLSHLAIALPIFNHNKLALVMATCVRHNVVYVVICLKRSIDRQVSRSVTICTKMGHCEGCMAY